MSKSDHKYVNFSEEHEINYILSLYEKNQRREIKLKLQELAQNKGRDNMTHNEVYNYLKSLGYEKKNSKSSS